MKKVLILLSLIVTTSSAMAKKEVYYHTSTKPTYMYLTKKSLSCFLSHAWKEGRPILRNPDYKTCMDSNHYLQFNRARGAVESSMNDEYALLIWMKNVGKKPLVCLLSDHGTSIRTFGKKKSIFGDGGKGLICDYTNPSEPNNLPLEAAQTYEEAVHYAGYPIVSGRVMSRIDS